MAGALKTSGTTRSNTDTLSADPVLFANGVAGNSNFIINVRLRVSAAQNNGGFKFNLRVPAGTVGFVSHPFMFCFGSAGGQPPRLLSEAGISLNIGVSQQDYFSVDYGTNDFDGIIVGEVTIRTPAGGGNVTLEWAQNRSVATGVTLGAGSYLSAGAP